MNRLGLTVAFVLVAIGQTGYADSFTEEDFIALVADDAYRYGGEQRIQKYVEAGLDRKTAESLTRKAIEGVSRCIVESVMAEVASNGQSNSEFLKTLGEKFATGADVTQVMDGFSLDEEALGRRAAPCFFSIAQESGMSIEEE